MKEEKLTMDTKEIPRIVGKYYEQLYANKLDNLDKIQKFLETYNLPKLNQEKLENLNRQMAPSEIEAVIKYSQQTITDFTSCFLSLREQCPSLPSS